MKGQDVKHEYEPGEVTEGMHTDPRCLSCGGPKRSYPHN